MFIKFSILSDGKLSTFTLVDLGGVSLKEQTYLDRNEINKSNNYLHYLIKELLGNNNSNPKLNKSSKILKELSAIVNGNSKLNFVYL